MRPDDRSTNWLSLALDTRPGRVPVIRIDGGGLLYAIAIAGLDADAHLVIRCADDGDIGLRVVEGPLAQPEWDVRS